MAGAAILRAAFVVVGASVPADIDPATGALDEAFRYDLDALGRVVLIDRDRSAWCAG